MISFLLTKGPRRFVKECRYRLVNAYHDRRLGIQTTRTVHLAEIGVTRHESIDSTPLGYAALFTILETLPVDPASSVFLDFGAGKGRAVCAAATLPFKRVIGLDLAEALIAMAEDNVRCLKGRKAGGVELFLTDATAFEIPPDVNVIYFYNPFFGETLRRVVANVRASWERHPRKIYVMFFNDDHFQKIIAGDGWIRRTRQASFYPGISCGVYETT